MVLAELTTYLVTQGIGTAGTNLFYGILPDSPDACVALFEYGGYPNDPVLGGTTVRLEYPSIQVMCRGVRDDYTNPRQKAQDVVAAFTKIGTQILSGVEYKAVLGNGPVTFLRRDENFRTIFVCSFDVVKAFSTT